MKKLAPAYMACVCLAVGAVASAAEAESAQALSTPELRQQERARLDLARQHLEDQYKDDLKKCYQLFDVTRCRLEARDRRIEAKQALRPDELRLNAVMRQVQADEAKARLAERNSEAARKDAEGQRAQSVSAARERSDAQAQKLRDHELQGTKRGAYEQKQQDAAQHRADVEKKQRERTKPPGATLPVPAP